MGSPTQVAFAFRLAASFKIEIRCMNGKYLPGLSKPVGYNSYDTVRQDLSHNAGMDNEGGEQHLTCPFPHRTLSLLMFKT